MNKFLVMAISLAMGAWLSGCNTTKGIGKDVEKTGEAVQDAAEKTSDELKKN